MEPNQVELVLGPDFLLLTYETIKFLVFCAVLTIIHGYI